MICLASAHTGWPSVSGANPGVLPQGPGANATQPASGILSAKLYHYLPQSGWICPRMNLPETAKCHACRVQSSAHLTGLLSHRAMKRMGISRCPVARADIPCHLITVADTKTG